MKRSALWPLAALLLAGCTVGPDYRRPTVDAPADFRGALQPATAESLGDLRWWQLFPDETLQSLIRTALDANYDVRIAAAILFVFLLLAAMYESWRLPWAVLLGSPLVALGAFFGAWLMGFDNNVYVQIGNIMLIGLAAKNAILIVEFAKAKQDGGMSAQDAAIESARLRFRPILMTAFAFILGVVPLMLASGAGSGAQNVMGTAVFWGMLVATALGVFIIPGNFAFVLGNFASKKPKKAEEAPPPEPHDAHGEH